MPSYVAMLRGVNVGGNTLKMERLRAICADLGLGDVRTYVQSGNVVCMSRLGAAKLAQAIKAAVDREARLPVTVVVRSADELARIVAENPFVGRNGVDADKLHVTFLAEAPAAFPRDRLDALAARRDHYDVAGREVYLWCPVNYGETRLSNGALEKTLGVGATTRNWKTVKALLEMAES